MPAAAVSGCPVGIVGYPDLETEEIATENPFTYTMHTDGSITHSEDASGDLRWVENTAPDNYEVRFGGSGSWLDFSTDRTITASSLIELRDRFTTSTVKSVTVTFS